MGILQMKMFGQLSTYKLDVASLEVVRELLNHGASVDIANNEGATTLTTRASESHVEIFLIFLNHGANLDIRDESGSTPLNVAAKSGHVGVADELLNRGTN